MAILSAATPEKCHVAYFLKNLFSKPKILNVPLFLTKESNFIQIVVVLGLQVVDLQLPLDRKEAFATEPIINEPTTIKEEQF